MRYLIVSSKMPTKNLKDFCPGSLFEGRGEMLEIFAWHFGRNDSQFVDYRLAECASRGIYQLFTYYFTFSEF